MKFKISFGLVIILSTSTLYADILLLKENIALEAISLNQTPMPITVNTTYKKSQKNDIKSQTTESSPIKKQIEYDFSGYMTQYQVSKIMADITCEKENVDEKTKTLLLNSLFNKRLKFLWKNLFIPQDVYGKNTCEFSSYSFNKLDSKQTNKHNTRAN